MGIFNPGLRQVGQLLVLVLDVEADGLGTARIDDTSTVQHDGSADVERGHAQHGQTGIREQLFIGIPLLASESLHRQIGYLLRRHYLALAGAAPGEFKRFIRFHPGQIDQAIFIHHRVPDRNP